MHCTSTISFETSTAEVFELLDILFDSSLVVSKAVTLL